MKLPYYLKAEMIVDGYTEKEKAHLDNSKVRTIGYKLSIRPILFQFYVFTLLIKKLFRKKVQAKPPGRKVNNHEISKGTMAE